MAGAYLSVTTTLVLILVFSLAAMFGSRSAEHYTQDNLGPQWKYTYSFAH